MAKSLNGIAVMRAARGSVLISMFAFAPMAAGENMADPTRPPASLRSAQDGRYDAAASGPVLQSVLVSPVRKVAIISGQTVNLGEKFGNARVTKISESEVTLSGSNGVQTLKLFPGIEKNATSNRKQSQVGSRRQ